MKTLAFSAALLATLAVAGAASAQVPVPSNQRYCLEGIGRDGPEGLLCRFETLEQCNASRNGNADRCLLNPYLAFRQR